MTLTLLIGADADSLLRDRAFQQQWNSLYAACPWATIFQCADFVTTWYEVYREPFKPLLISEILPDGSLGGLLTLAVSADSPQLVFAGAEQAEYHTWLARSDNGDTFIAAAMELLRASFSGRTLTFQYLPPTAPKQWLAKGLPWARQSRLATWTRPLMKLGDGEKLRKSLRKSGNKSRLNRMKRLGDVQFEHLHGAADLAAVFDDIIAYYDFRQGAVNDAVYFQADPLRKPFYLALMRIEDLLHVTVLKVGDRVVAAHLGLRDRKQCVLGIPTHSPFHALHSPGKLQLLMLGVELAQQGFDALDLTPGGDLYKERFATDHDEVHILTVFLSDRAWQKQSTELKIWSRATAGSIGKWLIGSVGIELNTAKEFTRQLRRLRLTTVTDWQQNVWKKLWSKTEYQIYCYRADTASVENHSYSFRRDYLDDLLLFQPVDHRQTRQDFLALCLSRLEAGQHAYTLVSQGRLLTACWLVERQEKSVCTELDREYVFEPESAVIYDYYLHPSLREQGYDRALLEQMVNDALFIYGAKQVYMTVLADDPLRQAIERTGFTYRQSTIDRSFG
jgi:CelD/BcsL family acetyltransferase involved in cellulose biosynthesis